MKQKFYFVFLAALILSSCRDGLQLEEEKYVQFAIGVQLDTTAADTKTTMSDSSGVIGKVKWSSGDSLTLYSEGDVFTSTLAQDISTDGTKALFRFCVSEKQAKYLADSKLYLYYGNTGILSHTYAQKEHSFSVSLPANQTHAGINCFNEFENIAFGYCEPGCFKYNEVSKQYEGTAGCTMHNAFGILKVPITGLNNVGSVRYVRLTDKTAGMDHYLAGTFNIAVNTSNANNEVIGVPTLSHNANTGGESRTIEKAIPTTNSLTNDNPYVYFLVPPGTLFGSEGLNIGVYTDDGYYGGKTIKVKDGKSIAIERSKITLLNIGPFVPKTYVPVIEPLSANSFIFDPTTGIGTFPAHYKGNGFQGNGGDIQPQLQANEIPYNSNYYPEIIWQTKCNGETLLAAEVVDSPVYYNSGNGPCISFHMSGVPGNALIALKNASGNILWSWHVWITAEKTATEAGVMLTQQYDPYGNVIEIMDRNLGALYADPTAKGKETQTYGLGYQFGRKDPYMGSRYTHTDQSTSTEYKSYASIYPGTAIYCIEGTNATNFSIAQSVLYPYQRSLRDNKDWCSELVSWGDLDSAKIEKATPKTLYDPCPVGWRTFEEKNIVAALGRDQSGAIIQPIGTTEESGEGRTFKLTNNGHPIYFPASGLSETTLAVTNVGSVVALWGANYASVLQGQTTHTQAHYIHITINSDGTYNSTVPAGNMENTMSVRCQRWTEPGAPETSQTGNTPTYVEDNEEVIL